MDLSELSFIAPGVDEEKTKKVLESFMKKVMYIPKTKIFPQFFFN